MVPHGSCSDRGVGGRKRDRALGIVYIVTDPALKRRGLGTARFP
jgi:hypothetical protein